MSRTGRTRMRATRSRRLGARTWPRSARHSGAACAVLTAAILAAALAGCGTRPASGPRWPAARVLKPPASILAPTPSPPAGVTGLRVVGANGATAWELTATSLSVTQDAGRHWSAVPLPAGVVPPLVTTVTAAAGRGLWLAVWRSPAIDLYHRDVGAATWSRRTLVPRLPSSLAFLARQAPTVSITLASAQLVTVVADWGFTSTSAYSTLFISSDDGTAFAQHPTTIGSYLWSATFVSAHQGIITAGPRMNILYRTDDGGASWSPVTIPGLPPSATGASSVSYGTPGADGRQLLLPVIVSSNDGAQSISIYRTTGAGAAFTGPTGPPLHVPAPRSAGEVTPAIAASVIWLPELGRIYESIDAGATWTTVTTAQSPNPISLISPSQAIGIATDSGCRSFKSDCYYYTYLVTSTDGGRTWRTL